MDPKEIITKDRITAAFNTFDIDHGGTISMDEIKTALCAGKNIDDKVWNTLISEVDRNGDDEITLDEFKNIMEAIFEMNTKTKKKAIDDMKQK